MGRARACPYVWAEIDTDVGSACMSDGLNEVNIICMGYLYNPSTSESGPLGIDWVISVDMKRNRASWVVGYGMSSLEGSNAPGPPSAFAIVLFSAVVTKSTRLQLILFAILLLLYGYIIFVQRGNIDPLLDYNVGGMTSVFMARASDFILLTNAQSTLRQRNQSQPAGQMTFARRSRWALDLILNLRGVGWSFEAPRLNRSTLQRWEYVQSQLPKLVMYFLFNDLVCFHNHYSRVFSPRIAEPMGSRGVVWQAWNVCIFWVTIWTPGLVHYTLASIIAVASGLSQPGDWPEPFGNWLKTDSIRTFWGAKETHRRTWHQFLRRPLLAHGRWLSQRVLRFPPGSVGSSYTQLYVSFCLSGLIHIAGDWKMAHNTESAKQIFQYFILQAVAITFEDAFFGLAKRWGFPRASRLIGKVWFVAWMVWSGPMWMEPMLRGGCAGYKPPVSVVERVYQWLQGHEVLLHYFSKLVERQ
ncbi:membrane bound O-acyl transferase family-domain-containing protein [Infundibulicybe gibba]|nr:membrane bound O-acyl transferase family-domain-containing protein [Infundibulicybe gibba]